MRFRPHDQLEKSALRPSEDSRRFHRTPFPQSPCLQPAPRDPRIFALWLIPLRMKLDSRRRLCGASPGMNKLVVANLLHRPLRSIISILAVAIEVVMILSIVGVFMGMLNDQKQRTNGIGADLTLRPSNASYMNGVGGAPMTAKNVEAIRRLPHVTVASPVITHLATSGAIEVIFG